MYRYILLAAIAFITVPAQAQQYGEVSGIITDSLSGETLPFASVSIERDGNIVEQTISDEFGKYYFSRIPEGIYELVVSYTGYQQRRFANIKVNGRDMALYSLTMLSGNDLPTVYIFPDIILETPIIGDEIDLAEIRQTGARDAGQIVTQTVAQVYSADGGEDGGIHISGARADATLYVVDGIRVIGSAYVPKSSIASITVYTGGIPANYGDVTGGIIEIRTRGYAGIW
ncbi:MAG TPA: hypothetical protein DHW15_10025 [Bacteroidetes bacterium]|jgi:hypothetical protein|nr:MAG: hypothetical protein ABR94_12155 [Sphingobacteriales bacterium BACL12 MAG-120802-bin5]HCK22476.1 hypothetical protein [Bacteroidota bacterium]